MNRVEINTYPEFWKIEMSITSIEGHQLPFSITMKKIFYFVITFALISFFMKIPGMHYLHKVKLIGDPAFIYLGVPGIATYYLNKQRIDGKQPYLYFIDMAVFLMTSKEYEYFKPVGKSEKYSLSKLKMYFRVEEVMNIFEFKNSKVDKKKFRYSHHYI
ncbi:MAG: hypothetical protein JXR88_03645 [Clostridia bacterium]|nr:hypothetical protein [Clostridia bacterium]